MNYSTALFLFNDRVRAVRGIYEAEVEGKPLPASTVFKTFDQSIKKGDYVLVPTHTRHKMTVNKIVEVDVEPDLESSQPMDWVIGVVDFPAYQQVLGEEARLIQTMKDAEKTARRNELREKLTKHLDEKAVEALAITQRSDIEDGPAPIEPPKT